MFTYLIQSSTCLIILYGIYHFVLAEMTFFKYNRAYLLLSILASLMIPILAPLLVLPEESVPVVHWSHIGEITYTFADDQASTVDWAQLVIHVLWTLYGAGVTIVLAKMIFGLLKIYKYYRQGEKEDFHNYKIIHTEAVHLPFSFFSGIYVSRHLPLQDHILTILEHEETHIRQWHTVDVLWAEMVHAFFWFNPVMIFYKRALRQAHEYLADDLICRKNSVSSYTELLLSKSQSGLELALTNQFFHSQIKKRIQMMTTNKTNRSAAWKYALVLPLLAGLVIVFSSSTMKQHIKEMVSTSQDTIPKPPLPPSPPILHGNPVMSGDVSEIISNQEFIKVVLKSGVSKYYYLNNSDDMKEYKNFYGQIPTPPVAPMPPPPPPSPDLLNTNPALFAKEFGFVNMPLILVDEQPFTTGKVNTENLESLEILKCESDVSYAVRKFGQKASNGAILIYTKSFRNPEQLEPNAEIFKVVQEMPRFPGCEDESNEYERKNCADKKMLEYIYTKLKYPVDAKQNEIEGMVVAQFVISKTGYVSEVKIIRDIGGGCGQAVADILQTMNYMPEKWIAGRQSGKNVNVLYTLPVKFRLTDDQPKAEISIGNQSKDVPQDALKSMMEMAAFPGSEQILEPMERMNASIKEMTKFIQKNLKYPTKAKENSIEGVVNIRMTLDAKGKVTDAILKEDIGYGCGEEALRVVKMMPNWIPATKDGKAVASTQTIPIGFKLKGDGNAENRSKSSIDPKDINIYPNPTSDQIELSLTGSKEDVEVSILDMAGKLLFKNKFDNRQEDFKTTIDISQIKTPTIIVKVVQNGKVYTNKVILRN